MKTRQDIVNWVEDNREKFIDMADKIWDYAEISHREFKSSKLQADFLEAQGFKITWEIADLQTAFTAEWGEGKPVLGFLGEFDGLEGLSQKRQPTQEPVVEGAPGQGCGHNLLGTGVLAACLAVKEWMAANQVKGTVRYYGCPAEENTYGKTFMARAGAFDDLDAAFNYHPSYANMASKARMVGVNDIKFRFHGKSAHAGGSPHLGRSALDAVELMNVGVNYLREHVTSNVRMHYAITHGGDLPNVVPPEAEVWYFLRALQPEEIADVTRRVKLVAEGAAMMTETEMEMVFRSACSATFNNKYLAGLHEKALMELDPIEYTEEEMEFAQTINDAYPKANMDAYFSMVNNYKMDDELKAKVKPLIGSPLMGINFPSLDEGAVETGSTDVGDVSQITPLSMLGAACFTTGTAGHSWGIVATSGMSIGHKGMLHAAKVMALAAQDCLSDPEHLKKAREEFETQTPYKSPLPDYVQAPRYENPYK